MLHCSVALVVEHCFDFIQVHPLHLHPLPVSTLPSAINSKHISTVIVMTISPLFAGPSPSPTPSQPTLPPPTFVVVSPGTHPQLLHQLPSLCAPVDNNITTLLLPLIYRCFPISHSINRYFNPLTFEDRALTFC